MKIYFVTMSQNKLSIVLAYIEFDGEAAIKEGLK